jgi:transmembrane sensor
MTLPPEETELPDLHQEAIAWLVKLRSNRLSPEDSHRFADWLSQDVAHTAAFADAEALFEDMAGAGQSLRRKMAETQVSAQPPISMLQTVPALTVASVPKCRSAKPVTRWLAIPMALAAVWLIAVTAILPEQSHLLAAYFSDYHTGTGEQREISLEDGSRVLLNTNSALSVAFEDNRRIVELQYGQARFTVAKDSNRPFIVTSHGLATKALGTVFDIYDPENGNLDITVQEHAVAVTLADSANGQAQQTPVVVQEGQQLSYQDGKELMQPAMADLNTLTAWQQQKLLISDRPLSELITQLNRYRNGRIYLGDAELANTRVSGVFSLQNPNEALGNLSNALGIKLTRMGWWVLLHR